MMQIWSSVQPLLRIYILLKEDIEMAMAGRERKLLIIDIANPRDVDEAAREIEGVELHDIDSLRHISDENLALADG